MSGTSLSSREEYMLITNYRIGSAKRALILYLVDSLVLMQV